VVGENFGEWALHGPAIAHSCHPKLYIFLFRQWGSTLYGTDTQIHRTDTHNQLKNIKLS